MIKAMTKQMLLRWSCCEIENTIQEPDFFVGAEFEQKLHSDSNCCPVRYRKRPSYFLLTIPNADKIFANRSVKVISKAIWTYLSISGPIEWT